MSCDELLRSDCEYSCVRTSRSEVTTLPSWRNTRSASRSKTRFRLGWTGCNGTLIQCGNRSNIGAQQLSAEAAKLTIYRAFIEGDLDVPRHLARKVHELYFNPQYEEFQPRTMWSLSNAFTSAFKELDPIPQFRATAKLGGFLEVVAG